MLPKKKQQPDQKTKLHSRNKHRERYSFKQLIESCNELAQYVIVNKFGDESIDFFNPEAVKMLNKSLLKHFYNILYWEIPSSYLTPPVPGRADYIHYIADLLSKSNNYKIPKGNKINCLDIGVGANCIYPIIGNAEYGWSFVGFDIDSASIESAQRIVDSNPSLKGNIDLRLQSNPENIFRGIIRKGEKFDLSICNPPFHSSLADAQSGSLRKLKNLKKKKISKVSLNFGGQSNELWCKGGEKSFVKNMINESKLFSTSCLWFTSLISKESNLKSIYKSLEDVAVTEVKTIPMGQGNKKSRIIAWTFFSEGERRAWFNKKK